MTSGLMVLMDTYCLKRPHDVRGSLGHKDQPGVKSDRTVPWVLLRCEILFEKEI